MKNMNPVAPLHPKFLSIAEILDARPQQPIATTRSRGWGGITLDLHQPYFGCAEAHRGLDHHLVCYCPSGSSVLAQGRDGTVHRSRLSAGVSFIMPAGYDSFWEGDSGLSARIRVPTSMIADAAAQLGRKEVPAEMRNVFETRDPIIARFAQSILAEMELDPHPVQRLVVESLSTGLAAHLLRSYNVFEPVEERRARPLGRLELQRLSTYIEEHLDGSISLDDLAAIVKVSRFHFSRLFKRTTGQTVMRFVEERRIGRAQALIADTDLPLAHVALLTGFADQSHFTRRFLRHVGCTPAVFAREQGRRRMGRLSPKAKRG